MARNVLYPLYQLGGPQLRVFRTNFFIQLVRPGTAQPEDTVQFRIPMEMTRVDLKNYLERIYNVPVAAVRTRVQHGSNRKRDYKQVRIKKPDYKVAYVQLAHGQTFTFPDLFPEKEPSDLEPYLEEQQLQRQKRDPGALVSLPGLACDRAETGATDPGGQIGSGSPNKKSCMQNELACFFCLEPWGP